ncbi:MAG: hypothetical protein P4L84_29735 [Isosphaeraceae bacterium]|nr:hypothetical protein [Isosphaeraceae bacterium]
MAPSDEIQTNDETTRSAARAATATAYTPHQNGTNAHLVNPFHLAIAELQADTDDADVNTPRPAVAETPPPRQTIMLTQPVRALGLGSWLGVGAVALLLGLLGGALFHGFGSREPQPAIDPALLKDLDDLKSRTGDLSKAVDGLNGQLAALPKPVPSPELSEFKKLENAVKSASDKWAKFAEDMVPINGRVKDLDTQANTLSDAVKGLRADVTAMRGKLDVLESSAKSVALRSAPTPEMVRRDEKVSREPALAQGVELFKKARYKDALSVFNKLELSNPDDARVWYFAALSLGMVTSEWGGGTAELVRRGIERERAGTPDSTQIDAAFKDLTVSTGKSWLEEYRKQAK